jgi:predicted AlkP superfamily phosphohydrolase/phosphomutase
MNEQVRQRTVEAISLMQNSDWDFSAIIFTELDRLQHFYWADMDAQHPLRPSNPVPNAIIDHYVELDRSLGQIMHMAGSEATLILMSDHGFAACSRQFCVNQWLALQGWLCLKSGNALSDRVSEGLKRLKGIPLMHKLKRALLGKQSLIEPFQKQSFYNQIDWSRTKAWYSETSGIRINVRGREPLGIVESDVEYRTVVSHIIEQALALRDPLSDKLVFQGAYRREEIYSGPQLGSAPDIILNTFHDDVYQNHVPTAFPIDMSADLFKNSSPYTGTHTDYGICASNAIPTFAISDLQDITKWIMSLYQANSSEIQPLENTAHDADVYNADDEAQVKDRLRSLGYLD